MTENNSVPYQLLIHGERIQGDDIAEAVINPRTGHTIADIPQASAEQVDAAVDSARSAFKRWKRTSPSERAAHLLAIAAAIDLGRRSFKDDSEGHKVMVIFTDGEEHQGDPLAAAEETADEGVRIITVGLGTQEGELIPHRDAQGAVNYHKDRRDQYVKTRLDERMLKDIALATEGDYYRSTRSGGELDAIYEQITGMEQKEIGTTRFTQYEERFQIPLLLALICFIAEAWLSDRRKAGEEWRGRFA